MCHLSQPQENMAATPALVSLLCSWLLLTEAATLVPARWLRIDYCLMWTGEGKFCQVTGQITLADDRMQQVNRTISPLNYRTERHDHVFSMWNEYI